MPLTCWRVGSHLLHPRGISRPLYKGFWELLGALSRQEPLELREKLGQRLFGEVFFTRSALAAHVFTMFSQCLHQLKRCVAKKHHGPCGDFCFSSRTLAKDMAGWLWQRFLTTGGQCLLSRSCALNFSARAAFVQGLSASNLFYFYLLVVQNSERSSCLL